MREWLLLAENQYHRKEVLALELKLLESMDWNIFQVTPYNFCAPWLKLLRVSKGDAVHFMFDFIIRAVYVNALGFKHKVSRITAAAIALSFVYLRCRDELD